METLNFWKLYSKLSLTVDAISSRYNDTLPDCWGTNKEQILEQMYNLNTNYKKLEDVNKDIHLFVENTNDLILGLEKYNSKYQDVVNEIKKHL